MRPRLSQSALLAGVALGLAAAPAAAQEEEIAARPAQPPRTTEAPVDRFGPFEGEQLQITTGTDDDTLTVGVALPTGASQENSFSLVASTPIRGNNGAMPASLDALANGSRVTLRWGHFGIGRPDPDRRAEQIVAQAQRQCVAAQPDPSNRAHVLLGGACADTNALVHRLDLPRYREYLDHIIHSGATDIGVEATVGVNDFEWVDPITLTPRKDRRTDWSVAGNFAHYLVRTKTAFTASISYQRAYEAADEQLLCPPNPVDPATQCITARGAAPSRNENLLLSIGLRHQFMRNGALLNLAVAPQLTYDAIDDVFGVDVPVYFMPGADGGLTGGIRFGYRSDRENEFSVGVFVGAAFSVLQ